MPINTTPKPIGNIILEEGTVSEDLVVHGTSGRRILGEGIVMKTGFTNRNKRMYRRADIKKELDGPRTQELLRTKTYCGEAGHPLSNDLVRQQTIDPKFTSVRYNKFWMKDDLVYANFQGTNNMYGEAFDLDLRDGVSPAFSIRCLGNIVNENGKAIVDNIKLITVDQVHFPSFLMAYGHAITESAISQFRPETHMDKIFEQYLRESATDYKDCTGKNISRTDQLKSLSNISESGMVIPITGHDATNLIQQMCKESASIDMIMEAFDGIATDFKVANGRIRFTTVYGETMYVPIDNYISNIIESYAYDL